MTTELEQALETSPNTTDRALRLTPEQEPNWAKIREADPRTGPVTQIRAQPKSLRTRYQEKFNW